MAAQLAMAQAVLHLLHQVVNYKSRGELYQAGQILEQATAMAPDDLRVWREQVDYHILMGAPGRAVSELRAHPRIHDTAMRILLARAHRHNQDSPAASDILTEILSQDPNNIEARYEFGRMQSMRLPIRTPNKFNKISVLVPSRFTRNPETGKFWLEHAIENINGQTIANQIAIEICVGIDLDAEIPAIFIDQKNVKFGRLRPDDPRSMPSALNRAAGLATGDVIAFLEDDDSWHPSRLEEALKLLEKFDFVSSTIRSYMADIKQYGFHDYATPTTWVMRRTAWDQVGLFNPSFPWHADAEWLGRLNQTKLLRCHQMESVLPDEWTRIITLRPFVFMYHATSRVGSAVHFTRWPQALCHKVIHTNTLTSQIETNAKIKAQSMNEYGRLNIAFGGRPF